MVYNTLDVRETKMKKAEMHPFDTFPRGFGGAGGGNHHHNNNSPPSGHTSLGTSASVHAHLLRQQLQLQQQQQLSSFRTQVRDSLISSQFDLFEIFFPFPELSITNSDAVP